MGFARARGRVQRLHQKRRGRDIGDGARLIPRQPVPAGGAHVQPGAGVALVGQGEDARLFGHDHI